MHVEPVEPQTVPAAAGTPGPATKRVLIVEDDRLLARIYWKKLALAGYSADLAGDGERGLEMVRQFRPDLVVLDLMLPKLNGIEVLTRLRADPATRDLPVVVFSNVFLGDLIAQARQAGATRIMSKSQDTPDRLVETITELVGPSTPPAFPTEATDAAATTETPRASFAATATRHAAELRRLLEAFLLRGSGDLSRLMALYQTVRSVGAQAGAAGCPLPAHIAAALEALLKELNDKPNAITPSARHTVARAVQSLAALLELPEQPIQCDFSRVTILAVDDDPVALRLVSHALALVRLRTECLLNPLTARQRLAEKTYDLILLDIEMPDLTGVQLCEQLRQLPANAQTPVIFVTAVNQFDSREDAIARGGDDLIAKPFLSQELAVKALTRLITARS